jgi:SAM-dependent methyltransferase
MPTAAELLDLYPPATYYAFRLRPPQPGRERLKRWLGFGLPTREPAFSRPGRVLDFGCGAGEHLLRMRSAGWSAAGVEVSQHAIAVARAEGLDVRTSLAGPEGFPEASFDYIRAYHSLEHVVDPAAVLRDMYRVLKPGGTLFLGVPTNDGMNARLFGPHWWYLGAPVHPVTFSTRGLVGLVKHVGFDVKRVSTNSDFGGVAGSLQILLNRKSTRLSSEGLLFRTKVPLLMGQWAARLQDALGMGDKLELIARKPGR